MKHVRLFFAKLHLFTFYDWQQNIKSEKTELKGKCWKIINIFEAITFVLRIQQSNYTALIENNIRF